MVARVFVPEARGEGERLDVPADEAAHLTRVLRRGVDDPVLVFDGRGHEWHATIELATKSRVVVALGARRPAVLETRIGYTVAVAVLKGDATDEVVRDVVMLGAAAIRPFLCARAEVGGAALARSRRRDRWARIAVASAKQCGRAVVPVIHEVVEFSHLLASGGEGARLLLTEPAVAGGAARLRDVPIPTAVTLAIGPEGGWTADEVVQATTAGWRTVRLGSRVLRADAMPLAALAACQAVWADDE